MSGQWPPEWEDSDTGLPDEWDIDDTGLDPESSMVTSLLASVPSPVLPSAFEARISAAIAAEATARANGTGSAGTGSVGTESVGTESVGTASAGTEPADAASAATGTGTAASAATASAATASGTAGPVDAETTDRSSSPQGSSPAATESGSGAAAGHHRRRIWAASRGAGRGSRPKRSRPDGRRRRLRMPSAAVSAPLLILLAIAGFALAISQFGGGSSSSSSVAASSGTSASVPSAAAGSAHGASGRAFRSQSESGTTRGPAFQGLNFSIGESGISYSASTIAGQVRTELNALNPPTPAASAPSPAASNEISSSASASAPVSTPVPPNLKGCVSYLTKGATPSLVDRSTYDGIPAYIIAVPSRVWVVRLGCTAANRQEITSVSLTGLSGNLSALGSVEGYASPEERRME